MHFVIAGVITCPQFTYAVMIAQRLQENLPGFTYLKLAMKQEKWEKWLIKICREEEWYHTQSPLIWREIGLKQGKKELIGDINKFLDLCYDYYGIPRRILSAESFNRGEMNWFTNRTESEFFEKVKQEAKRTTQYKSRQVCITGAACQKTEIIIMELLQMASQKREDGLEIRLFDDPSKVKKLASSANDGNHCPGPSGFGNCRVVTTLKDALTNVDMVIVLDTFPRKPRESLVKWLKRNRNAMASFGRALNIYAPTHCRVIIGSSSSQPTCYNATVLAKFATRLHVRNIVVVTQDLGREILQPLASKLNVPLKDFYCPPVWGFVGLNRFIDVSKTLQTHLYEVPGKRVNSTIPQGSEEYELRTSECLISEEETGDLHVSVADHKAELFPQLGRWPCLAKATAIIDLLKLWGLKQEDGNGEILCLGVYSDGTFNIPQGIYWSQPVILKKGFWVPFEDFPIPRSSHFNCFSLFLYSIAALYRTKIKPRIYIQPKPSVKQSEKKKFDMEKLTESVGLPVIRNDGECLIYLKYLAKVELGIDFDVVDDAVIEESEPEIGELEEVKKEKIYCECWRQELKQLQRIVFDRSSTTEVEVDLSDNVSGSEWSVINTDMKSSAENKEYRQDLLRLDESSQDVFHQDVFHQEKPHKTSLATISSTSVVCSCEAKSTGSICRCLEEAQKKQPEVQKEEISTEHYYKEQNAEIFNVDLKDAIYADAFIENKSVAFDAETKPEGEEKDPMVKFYGKKDAIRDRKYDSKMRKRIRRYEKRGEDSSDEEEENLTDEDKKSEEENPGEELKRVEKLAAEDAHLSLQEDDDSESFKPPKFNIHIEGLPYEIVGDQAGIERLAETQMDAMGKVSTHSFRQLYIDEISTRLTVLSPKADDNESSIKDISYEGESKELSLRDLGEILGEKSVGPVSMATLEEALDEVWGEQWFFDAEEEGEEEEEMKEPEPEVLWEEKKRKVKREGIPLCCLCRCIVPRGIPYCPCGAETVVEVFKKESGDVFIQNEDDLTFKIEYFETSLRQESIFSGSIEMDVTYEDTSKPSVIQRDLPPESFFPFSPKSENKFTDSVRPEELRKQNTETLNSTQKAMSERCTELLNLARLRTQETTGEMSEVSEDKSTPKSQSHGRSKMSTLETEDEDVRIKTDFSNLNLFIPDGIEDWRLTVQRKYREWFFEGPKIRDDSYYDVAIEEVSEDEFEIDKELEQYFET